MGLHERMAQLREDKYVAQAGRCGVCNRHVRFAMFQLAHRIPQRKWCVERWGEEVIHHPKNIVGVCGLACNARAQMNPVSVFAEMHAAEIRVAIEKGEKE